MSVKKCLNCNSQVDESVKFCPTCGGAEFEAEAGREQAQSFQFEGAQLNGETQTNAETQSSGEAQSMSAFQGDGTSYAAIGEQTRENVLAGIVGAFLFSLVGVVLYFILNQVNVIAGISALVMFVMANFGYTLFSKAKTKSSIIGLVVSIILTVVMIFLSEYLCLSYEIFREFKDEYAITLFDAVRATPEFLKDPDVAAAVAENLVYAYIFGFIATISSVVNIVKGRKRR